MVKMDLAFIDLTANRGGSVLHRSSAISKFLFTFALIFSIVLANHLTQLFLISGILVIGYFLAGLGFREVGHYALYPAFFSLIFAIFKFTISFSAGFTVILKAVTAALALLLFIFTTPYPEIFGILRKFLPGILVDGMFFTYRIFFILIKEVQNLLMHIRLRGGYQPLRLISNLKNIAGALGVLFIHSFDLSERMYQMLSIRGYTGHLHTERLIRFRTQDYILVGAGVAAIILVVMI